MGDEEMIKKITNVIEISGLFTLIVYTCAIMNYWINSPELSQMVIFQQFQKETISIVCVIVFYFFVKEFIFRGEFK